MELNSMSSYVEKIGKDEKDSNKDALDSRLGNRGTLNDSILDLIEEEMIAFNDVQDEDDSISNQMSKDQEEVHIEYKHDNQNAKRIPH